MNRRSLQLFVLSLTLFFPVVLSANSTTVRGGCLSVRSHGGTSYTVEATLLLTAYPAPTDTFRMTWSAIPVPVVFNGMLTGFMLDYPCVPVADGYQLTISWPQTFYSGPHIIYLYAGNRVANISNMTNSGTSVFTLFAYVECDSYAGPNGTPYTDSLNLQVNMPLNVVTTVPNVLYDDEGDSIELVLFYPIGGTAYVTPDVTGGGGLVLYPEDSTYEWDPQMAGLYTLSFMLNEYYEYGAGNWLCRRVGMREVLIDAGNATHVPALSMNAITAYPNPATDRIQFSELQECVELINVQGEVVLTAAQVNAIDVSALAPGVYSLRIKRGVRKIVVQ